MSGVGYSVNLTKQYLIVLSRVILGDQHCIISEDLYFNLFTGKHKRSTSSLSL